MKKYIGAIVLLVLSPLLLSLIVVHGFFYGVSIILLWIYDFIYWPIYDIAGSPFNQKRSMEMEQNQMMTNYINCPSCNQDTKVSFDVVEIGEYEGYENRCSECDFEFTFVIRTAVIE